MLKLHIIYESIENNIVLDTRFFKPRPGASIYTLNNNNIPYVPHLHYTVCYTILQQRTRVSKRSFIYTGSAARDARETGTRESPVTTVGEYSGIIISINGYHIVLLYIPSESAACACVRPCGIISLDARYWLRVASGIAEVIAFPSIDLLGRGVIIITIISDIHTHTHTHIHTTL